MTRILALCRAAAATLTLIALVFLSPALLTSFGNPISEVIDAFSNDLASDASRSETLLVGVLVVIGWIAWLMITAAIVNEVRAAARGRMARTLPLLPGMQSLARTLVSSVTLVGALLSTTHVAVAPLAPMASVTALTEPGPHDLAEPHGAPDGDAPMTAPAGPSYRVVRSDTWWSMAERLLGTGSRWHEIVAANEGRTMVDGTLVTAATPSPRPGWTVTLPNDAVLPLSLSGREDPPATPDPNEHLVMAGDTLWEIAVDQLPPGSSTERVAEVVTRLVEANRSRVQPDGRSLTDPNVLEPGWILTIPPLPKPEEMGSASPDSVVVQAGDTLWDLAEVHLDSGERYPEIVDLNRGVTQPDGRALEDPDLILPGWRLDLPPSGPSIDESPPAVEKPPAEGTGSSETPPADAEPVPATPSTAGTVPTTSPETPAPVVPSSLAPSTQPAHVDHHDPATDESRAVPVGLLAGGIATAGVVLMLDRRRRVQRQRRRSGHVLPAPPVDEEVAEYCLRDGTDVLRAERVAVALQAAAAGLGNDDLPAIRYVSATDDSVRVHLADVTTSVPAGFEEVDGTWVTAVPHAELVALAEGGIDPLPLLCPIGTTADGTEILVDLDRVGVAWISGPDDRVTSLLRSMALSLSTSVWASSPRVVAVGMSGGIAELDWVDTTLTLTEGLAVASRNLPTNSDRRSSSTTLDPGDPVVVVSGTTCWETHRHQLEEISDGAPSGNVAVLPGPGIDGVGAVMTVDNDGRIRLPDVDIEVRANGLSDDDVRVVLDILDHAAELGTDVPSPSELPVGVRPLPTLADELEGYDVLVRVMGDVTVERLGRGTGTEPVVFERTRSQEAVVYLAAREEGRGVAIEDVRAALWPDGRAVDQTVRNTVSRARRGLGDDSDGEPYLPSPVDGRYHLSDRVVTDFELFWSMRQTASELDDPDLCRPSARSGVAAGQR